MFHVGVYYTNSGFFCPEEVKPYKDVWLSLNTVAVSDKSCRVKDIMSRFISSRLASTKAQTLVMSHSCQSLYVITVEILRKRKKNFKFSSE